MGVSEVQSGDIVDRVNRLLEHEFELQPSEIAAELRLKEDLQLDSLDAVDLLAALERELGIPIDDERAKAIRTVQHVYDYVADMQRTAD